MQHLSSYLHQCGKTLTIFLNHFTPVKGIHNYKHIHIIKSCPDNVFTKRTCTNDADDNNALAHNPEEEFDRQTLPDNLLGILPADGLFETKLAYSENMLAEYTNVVQGKSYPFAHVGG